MEEELRLEEAAAESSVEDDVAAPIEVLFVVDLNADVAIRDRNQKP